MKQLKFLTILSATFLFIVAGCKKDEGNPAGPGTTTPTQPAAPTPTSYNGTSPTNVMAVVRTSTQQTVPVLGTITVDANAATAVFGSPGTDKGNVTVTVGGSATQLGKLTVSGAVSYIFPDPANPTAILTLGGSAQAVTFAVANYALSPNGTVAVPGQLTLTAPAVNASVPRNATLNVTWTVSGGAGSRHAIFIADAQGHTLFKDGVANGSGSFSAAELAGFSAGTAWVYALTYNFNLVNSNDAVIVGEAVAINQITLQ
ncbi:MAG: hypothetical protein KF749_13555 [Bacteroidetes bacterium]|nr:hypothetical protein [Bacteroidota bacterium]MCW5895280.1 hypothetical protein [Bacteroidota bacterium]